jgi:uncharacterized damage-inducible protein DinB
MEKAFVNLADYLRRQFAYDEWANREVLSTLRANTADERSLQLMNHIFAAQRIWFERLQQQPQSVPVWPKFDLGACEAQGADIARLWTEYLGRITDAGLPQFVSYKNSKGEVWSSTVLDILTHVIMHSAYHRGQIASHTRETGHTPPYTDFIHAVREGLIE